MYAHVSRRGEDVSTESLWSSMASTHYLLQRGARKVPQIHHQLEALEYILENMGEKTKRISRDSHAYAFARFRGKTGVFD
jgi:hypothetical protein